MKRFIIIAVLIAICTFLVNTVLTTTRLFPVAASLQAGPIDKLFNLQFTLISFLFSLIVVVGGYSLVMFRQKPGDNGAGAPIKGNSRLEIFWTAVPLITVLYLSFLGAKTLANIRAVDPQALRVNVTAGQWYYQYEYPDFKITTDTLYLPVDRQVWLSMTSKDVIHSFWVPEFRLKQDILPGKNLVKQLRVTPTLIGDYKVRCSQLCGTNHAGMESPVKVVSQASFDQWVGQQQAAASNDPVARGKSVAAVCTGCHTVDGSKGAGPTWKGLAGTDVVLESDQTVKADDAYLKKSIIDPNAEIVKGYKQGLMPANYGKTLSPEKIDDVIAFIKSLK